MLVDICTATPWQRHVGSLYISIRNDWLRLQNAICFSHCMVLASGAREFFSRDTVSRLARGPANGFGQGASESIGEFALYAQHGGRTMMASVANVLIAPARRLAGISAVFTFALLCASSAPLANAATIVAHFDTSSYGATDAEGLAFDGSFLYLLNDVGADQRVYRVDRMTGVGTFAFIAPGDDAEGIAFDGTNLRISGGNGLIYTVDRLTGAILGSVPAPGFQIDGLAYGAGRLYASSTSPAIVYELDPATGVVTAQFATDGIDGLEYIAGSPSLLLLGDVAGDRILITRASDLSVIDTLNLTDLADAAGIAGADNPYGLAYDGEFVYYVDHTRHLLVKVDVDLPNGTVAEPGGLALVALGLAGLFIRCRVRGQVTAHRRAASGV